MELDLSGQTNVVLSYARRTKSLEADEYLQVAWTSNGTDWIELEQVGPGVPEYETKEWFLPAEAYLSTFGFRFRTTSSSWQRSGFIDDVLVTARADLT